MVTIGQVTQRFDPSVEPWPIFLFLHRRFFREIHLNAAPAAGRLCAAEILKTIHLTSLNGSIGLSGGSYPFESSFLEHASAWPV